MNHREKIIIFLAIFAALYGLFDYFIFSSSKNNKDGTIQSEITKKTLKGLTKINENLTALKTMYENQKEDSYVISMIETEWENDPFIKFNTPSEKSVGKSMEVTTTIDIMDLKYSGFIQFGKKIFAVINGMEYATGEYIKNTEYKIVRITSNTIVLNNDKNKQTVLFLKEE